MITYTPYLDLYTFLAGQSDLVNRLIIGIIVVINRAHMGT